MRGIKFTDKIIVIDVESTCDENKEGFISEIIEIGMTDSNGKEIPSIFVKPKYSIVTPFCTRLTTLTPEEIEAKGQEPEIAYKNLESIFSKYTRWASYGYYDKKMFEKMSSLYGLDIRLPPIHINVRLLFAQEILNSNDPQKAPRNPKDALIMLGKEFQGVNHRGEDDAINIANLYNLLIQF